MAATLQLARNTHVYMKVGTNYWKLPVLDGFSFSQSTATQELALNEMQDTTGFSNRGRTMFTNALEPAEWSFSMYARPTLDTTTHSAVEEALWALFFGATTYNAGAWSRAANPVIATPVAISRTAANMQVTSANSNVSTLGEFELFFVFGGCSSGADDSDFNQADGQTIYKLDKCVVNSASIDFDIDGITTINWSGFGATVTQQTATLDVSAAIETGLSSTTNYLRNRVTSLSVKPNDRFQGANIGTGGEADDLDQDSSTPGNEFAASYDLTLTGGTINFENNITFLTPDELCKVNQPIGHVTGNRTIGGNFTCYLNDTGNRSAKFFDDLASATGLSQNGFEVIFTIGGGTLGQITIDMPICHIETPVHQVEDIISLETTFHALPSTMTGNDDVTLTYVGVA
jgi:hypothetical protein